jgi:hypothetical protein
MELRPAQCAARHLHGVAGAALRLLQHDVCFERLDHGRHLLRLVAYHDDSFPWFQRGAGSKDVFN